MAAIIAGALVYTGKSAALAGTAAAHAAKPSKLSKIFFIPNFIPSSSCQGSGFSSASVGPQKRFESKPPQAILFPGGTIVVSAAKAVSQKPHSREKYSHP